MPQEYTVIIERDEEGYYVATVPQLHGCHTQARSLDELMERVKEAIELCVEVGLGLAAQDHSGCGDASRRIPGLVEEA